MNFGQPQPQEAQIDIHRLSGLKQQMDKLAEQRKVCKTQVDEIESQCIAALVQMGVRYVDESANGAGPFWSLVKSKSDGSWNTERYNEFFAGLLTELNNGKQFTPSQCSELAVTYLKNFEKRKLALSKLQMVRQKNIDDLRLWLAGKDV